jgi:hypothetical protein
MDRARRDLAVQAPKHYATGRPTFSIRSPARPNPIALAVVELRKVDGNVLHVVGVDCPRQHPAPRHQALFPFGGFHSGRPCRLARCGQTLTPIQAIHRQPGRL